MCGELEWLTALVCWAPFCSSSPLNVTCIRKPSPVTLPVSGSPFLKLHVHLLHTVSELSHMSCWAIEQMKHTVFNWGLARIFDASGVLSHFPSVYTVELFSSHLGNCNCVNKAQWHRGYKIFFSRYLLSTYYVLGSMHDACLLSESKAKQLMSRFLSHTC